MRSKFNLDFVVYDSAEFKAHPDPWATFPRIIASIDTAKRESKQEQVLAAPYDLVIVDEAHHLKKQRSQSYQLVSRLKKKYILLLTATPVENDLEELFNLITLLFPGQLETAASLEFRNVVYAASGSSSRSGGLCCSGGFAAGRPSWAFWRGPPAFSVRL